MKLNLLITILILSTATANSQIPSECLATEEKLYVQALITENENDLKITDLDIASCDGDDVLSGMRKAKLYRENNQLVEAQEILTEMLKRSDLKKDESAEIEYLLGELYYEGGRFNKAIYQFQRAETAGKSTWYTRHEIGRSYMRLNDPEMGAKIFESHIIEHPTSHSSYSNLAFCYERMDRVTEALTHFKKAYQLSDYKESGHAYNALMLMRDTDRVKEGIEFGLEAIEKGPQHVNFWFEVSYFYNKIGEHEKAVEFTKRMVQKFPESAAAYFRLAYSYAESGRVKEALKYYFQGLKYRPNDKWTLHNIGIHYREIGQFEKSHMYADMAIAIDPRREFYITKVNAYQWAHQLKEYLDLCIWIDENFDPVGNWELEMGYAYMVNEKYKEAIEWHLKYIQKFPDDSRAHNNIARCYDKSGDYKMAEHHYAEALRCNIENSFVYHNMASMHADLGQAELACEYLATALEKEYNWVIDENLIAIHDEHCPEISLDRTILLFGYKGNLDEYEGQSFIEIRELDEAFQEQILQEVEAPEEIESKVIPEKNDRFQLYSVYPNPSQDRFFIEPNTDSDYTSSTTVKVFDMNSKLVLQQALVNGTKEMIDLSDQPSGTYILLISDEEQVLFNQRLVVVR